MARQIYKCKVFYTFGGSVFEGEINQDYRYLATILGNYVRGKQCLDAGCGHGIYCNLMVSLGAARVFGVDFDHAEIDKAKTLNLANASFEVADAANLPFTDQSFDFVLSTEVLTHLPPEKREKAVSEVYRVLRSGGHAMITFHNRHRTSLAEKVGRKKNSKVGLWPVTPEEMVRSAERNGFKVKKIVFLNYYNRLSQRLATEKPLLAKIMIFSEEVLHRLPVLQKYAIVFLMVLEKNEH